MNNVISLGVLSGAMNEPYSGITLQRSHALRGAEAGLTVFLSAVGRSNHPTGRVLGNWSRVCYQSRLRTMIACRSRALPYAFHLLSTLSDSTIHFGASTKLYRAHFRLPVFSPFCFW
jgi:hypothetical protein